jgi:thermostable 8-oxoguanine DNA glycosylase
VSRDINLATCTPQELEAITGIGEKTSRFFILHTRKNARVAAIDTHMLKYLRAVGVGDVPDKSPKGATYLRLEKQFIELADKSGMSIADFDLMIWNFYAGHSPEIKWVWPNKSQCIA